MSSIKKKQEEKNLKILRELLSFENNRYCFDCNQRGPTYVNITIGSFVCTNCGGAVRKYNHRVKSISMSNFSQSEIDFIKKRGNNICKKIYYGLCENNNPSEPDIKNGMIDSHLRSKYELKKWYLEPTPELEEETLNANQLIFDKVEKGAPKSIKTYTVNSSSNIIIDPPKPLNPKMSSRGSRTSIDLSESSNSHPKASNGVVQESINPAKLGGGSSVKLPMPSDLKNTNWLSTINSKNKSINSSPFDDDFIFKSEKSDLDNDASFFPKSQTMTFSMPQLVPVNPITPTQHVAQQDQQNRATKTTDKYAVLAELDDLFSNINTNKHNPVGFSVPMDSSNLLTTGIHKSMGWTTTNQFNDVHLGSVANPFSSVSHQSASTFNPFVTRTDFSHMPTQISTNWPHTMSASVAPSASSNPFSLYYRG